MFNNFIIFLGLLFSGVFYKTKILHHDNDKQKSFKLRGEIFGDYLKWIDVDEQGRDVDKYDFNAVHFGVFGFNKILACSRIILPDSDFMLENEFKMLLDDYKLKKNLQTVEISRLAVSREFLGKRKNKIIQALLYRSMYRWSKKKGIRFWYIEVEKKYFCKLQKSFGFRKIGKEYVFPDGVVVIAGLLDLRMGEKHLKKINKLIYFWYLL